MMTFAEKVKLPSLTRSTPYQQAALWAYMQNKKYFLTGVMSARYDGVTVIDLN